MPAQRPPRAELPALWSTFPLRGKIHKSITREKLVLRKGPLYPDILIRAQKVKANHGDTSITSACGKLSKEKVWPESFTVVVNKNKKRLR